MSLEDNKKNNYQAYKNKLRAQKYKFISEEIKNRAGLYFLKLKEIDGEIKLENEINIDAEKVVDNINHKVRKLKNL